MSDSTEYQGFTPKEESIIQGLKEEIEYWNLKFREKDNELSEDRYIYSKLKTRFDAMEARVKELECAISNSINWIKIGMSHKAEARLLTAFNGSGVDRCIWKLDQDTNEPWVGTCGIKWCFEDEGPVENGVKFCPGCGKLIEVVSNPYKLEAGNGLTD